MKHVFKLLYGMHIDKKDLQTVKKNGSKDNDFQHS